MQLLKPKQSKPKKIKSTARELGNAALAGAGTGSLIGLLAKPDSGQAQRAGALIGAGVAVGKSLIKPKKPKKKTM